MTGTARPARRIEAGHLVTGLTSLLRGACLPALLLVAWFLASHSGRVHGGLLVPPGAVVTAAYRLFHSGELGHAAEVTLARFAAGSALGVAAGILVGISLGLWRFTRLLFGPTWRTLQQVSLFAWVPLLMAWFGIGEGSKLAFIAIAAFFPVMLGTLEGVGSVPRDYVDLASTYEFTALQLLRKVVWPAALPSVFGGLHLSLVYAWLATLGSEYLMTSGGGLGALLLDGQAGLHLDQVLLVMMLTALIGVALGIATGWLERRLLRWKHSHGEI